MSAPAGSSTVDQKVDTRTMDIEDCAMETDDDQYEPLRECDVIWETDETYTILRGRCICTFPSIATQCILHCLELRSIEAMA